jgi:hypothetical protein
VSQENREALSKLFPGLTYQLYLQAHERLGRNKYCDLSAVVVSFPNDAVPELREWFRQPQRAFTEDWFRFPQGLAPDVAFAVDVETREGGKQYAFNTVPQAGWMALVYFYPTSGIGSVFWGNDANLRGEKLSSTPNFQNIYHYFFDTGVRLKPDTWYRLRVEAD